MKKILLISAVIILIGVILYFSIFHERKRHGKEVYTHEVERGDILSAVLASGRIEPRMKVNISSNVIGEIVELAVKEGDRVGKGSFLLQLDKERYLSEVERLEANLRLTKILMEKERINLKNIENSLNRMRKLYRDQIISDDAIEDAELEYETGKINLKSLNEQINQAEAGLGKAQDELKKTTIISPMDGIVTQLNAEVGEQVIMGTINNPGTVIMVISDMREVLAEVDVDETEIVSVKKGNESRIKVDAIGDKYDYEGFVEEIGNTALKQGEINIFHVKVKIRNPDERLRPGMTARAKIETESRYDILKVPIQAVVLKDIEKEKEKARKKKEKSEKKKAKEEEEKLQEEAESEKIAENEEEEKDQEDIQAEEETTKSVKLESGEAEKESSKKWEEKEREAVYLMVDGEAVLTPVETGISDELDVEITSGLKEGDVVVTGPYRILKNLKDGDKIKEKEEKKEAEEEEEEGIRIKVED